MFRNFILKPLQATKMYYFHILQHHWEHYSWRIPSDPESLRQKLCSEILQLPDLEPYFYSQSTSSVHIHMNIELYHLLSAFISKLQMEYCLCCQVTVQSVTYPTQNYFFLTAEVQNYVTPAAQIHILLMEMTISS